MTSGFRSVPQGGEHKRDMATVLQQVLKGKINAVYSTFTLTANVATTTLTDARLAAGSFVMWMPTTVNAATEFGAGTMYPSTRGTGAWIFTHANNANADRTFVVLIVG